MKKKKNNNNKNIVWSQLSKCRLNIAEIEWLQIQIFYYDQKHYLHILMVTKYMINMTVQLFKGLIMQQGHNTVRKSQ